MRKYSGMLPVLKYVVKTGDVVWKKFKSSEVANRIRLETDTK